MFANTNRFLQAHVVRVSDADDLALLQVDVVGTRPTVQGVSRAAASTRVGSPVVTIGYPLSNDTPMEGSGLNNMTARTTTTPGTVSKRLDDVLQLDSFSAHGASGSPLFDAEGNVIGVIYGGAKESGGRIVYAVPAPRVAAFLGAEGSSVVR
jgi:S1-C subfamily serine protease